MFRRILSLTAAVGAAALVAPATPASAATATYQRAPLPVATVSADRGSVLNGRLGEVFNLSNGARIRVTVTNTCVGSQPRTKIVVHNFSRIDTPDLGVSVSDGQGRGKGGSGPVRARRLMGLNYNLAQQTFGLSEGPTSLLVVNANGGYEYGCVFRSRSAA